MRDVAILSFAQTPYLRSEKRLNEVEMLMPVLAEAIGAMRARVGSKGNDELPRVPAARVVVGRSVEESPEMGGVENK